MPRIDISKRLAVLALLSTLAWHPALAAEKIDPAALEKLPLINAPATNVRAELQELLATIQGKLEQGQQTEKELAPELRRFDVLLVLHREEKTDDVAQVLLAKAMLYFEVFADTDRCTIVLNQLKSEFPATPTAKKADSLMTNLKQQAEARKLQGNLVVGSRFPDFAETDVAGKPLALASYRGKVVLIQFWASRSTPSANEIPTLLNTYGKFHSRGFEVIGISLDEDRRDLLNYMKKESLPWPQYFDGKGWGGKLAVRYSVVKIPTNYLLDGEGKIVGRNVRGRELEEALGKLLEKK